MSGILVQKEKGFTIVELLIVIVVIGILAAVIIVTFNGVQERARSTAIITRAQAYIKGLKLWEIEEGRPTTDSCIAPSSYSPCGGVIDWGASKPNDSTFNTTLAKYSGISTPVLGQYGPDTPVGLMYYHSNWYGQNRGVLGYRVGPNSDCGLSPLLDNDQVSYAPAGQKYTMRISSYTKCVVEVFKY